METLLATCSRLVTGEQNPGRWWNCSGLDRRSEGIPWYTNTPMTVFLTEGTVVATGRRYIKIFGFLLIILSRVILAKLCLLTIWAVLAWQQGLVRFPQKKTPPTNLETTKYAKMQKYCDFIIFIFS